MVVGSSAHGVNASGLLPMLFFSGCFGVTANNRHLEICAPRAGSNLEALPSAYTIDPDIVHVQCRLQQLGQITIEPVSSRYCIDSKIWFALMDRYH
jgi:hypothetical protein